MSVMRDTMPRMKNRTVAISAVAGALVLVGVLITVMLVLTSESDSHAKPPEDVIYDSVADVFSHLETDADMICDAPYIYDDTKMAAHAARCSYNGGELIVSTYSSRAQLTKYLQFSEDFASMLKDPTYLAVGGNWTVNCGVSGEEETCTQDIVDAIGGRIWSSIG